MSPTAGPVCACVRSAPGCCLCRGDREGGLALCEPVHTVGSGSAGVGEGASFGHVGPPPARESGTEKARPPEAVAIFSGGVKPWHPPRQAGALGTQEAGRGGATCRAPGCQQEVTQELLRPQPHLEVPCPVTQLQALGDLE